MVQPSIIQLISSAGRPCKIVDMSTSKTGKHGHAKVHLVAIDVSGFPQYFVSQHLQIFTGKKLASIPRFVSQFT
jgi:hypothetical protein